MFFCVISKRLLFDCPIAAASGRIGRVKNITKHNVVNWSAADLFVRCLYTSDCS